MFVLPFSSKLFTFRDGPWLIIPKEWESIEFSNDDVYEKYIDHLAVLSQFV